MLRRLANLSRAFVPYFQQQPRQQASPGAVSRVRFAALLTALSLAAAASLPAQAVLHLNLSTPVKTPATAQTVAVTVTQGADTVKAIRVLTLGAESLDFTNAGGGTCAQVFYATNSTCSVNVTFTPTAPGRRSGAVVLIGNGGEVMGTQLIDATGVGPLSVIRPGVISLAAGSDLWNYQPGGDGIPATRAQIYLPTGVAADAGGSFYISDSANNRIRKVNAAGIISTYGGNGIAGGSGDGHLATTASISSPGGMALDGAGNLYFADTGNSVIRRIDAVTGIISTVAGQMAVSSPKNTVQGDGGPATSALLNFPGSVSVDPDGNLYIADTNDNVVRRVDALTNIITTVAGDGTAAAAGSGGDGGPATAARLNAPQAVSFDSTGRIYIADRGNSVVRRIDTAGNISTIAGKIGQFNLSGDGGLATAATLKGPAALAIDPAGNLYIADSANNRVRRVDAITGIINTIAGGGIADTNTSGDGGNANVAVLSAPYALAFNGTGDLYVADLFHYHVRLVRSNFVVLNYQPMRVSKVSAPQMEAIENNGNSDLTLSAPVFDQSALDASSTTCVPQGTVSAGTSCALGVQFAPQTVADAVKGTLTYPSDGTNAPDLINLFGPVLSVEPTAVTLTSSLNPAGPGQTVTFTAVVTETSGTTIPTGTVTFHDGSTVIGTGALDKTGTATFATSTLSLGQHTIVASYDGDASNAAATSTPLTENILQPTKLLLGSSLNPSQITQSVTFTATLTAQTPVTSGNITFLDGVASLGTAPLQNGVATLTTSTLSVGTHLVTARFGGDTSNLGSTSDPVSQVVSPVTSTTLLGASPSATTVGESVTFTITVTSNGGPAPTGSVRLTYNNANLGTAQLDGNGNATLTTTALVPGNDVITATYSGDANNKASSSTGFLVTVKKITTVTSVNPSVSPANAGSPVTFTASVALSPGASPNGDVTGTVTFHDGNTVLGTVTLQGASATWTANTLTVGTHSVTATYNGNFNYDTSTSGPLQLPVQKSTSNSAVSVNAPSIIAGRTAVFTANVTTAGVKPTGLVVFSDENGTIGNGSLNANGVATYTTTTVPVGSHNIVATYNGDNNYNPSTSASQSLLVRIGTTALSLGATPQQIQATQTVTFTPTLTTDGALLANTSVALMDNGSTLATLTLNAQGTVTYPTTALSVGTHNIVAVFAGDASNAPAQSPARVITVAAATTATTLTSSQSPALVSSPVTFTAKVASEAANLTGTVAFMDGATTLATATLNPSGTATATLSNLAVGPHSIVAVYSADTVHASSTSAAYAQSIVNPATVTINSSVNPAIAGAQLNLIAQVVTTATGSAAPSGSVTFHEGATVIGTAGVNGSGVATFATSSLPVGTHTIVATYSGDRFYQTADSAVLAQMIRSATTVNVLNVSANPAIYGVGVTLAVQLTGNGGAVTGTVNFLDGTASLGQVALASNGSASITTTALTPGMHTLTAAYAGDSNNSASVSNAVTEQVQQRVAVTLASGSNPALTLSNITLTATVQGTTAPVPTGEISFRDGATLLGKASLDGNGNAVLIVPPLAAGTHSITATYAGDVAALGGASPTLQQVVNLRTTQSTLTATPPNDDGVLSLISVVRWDGPNVPTGVVTFRTATGNILGTATVDKTGVATLGVTSGALTGKIFSSYSGDSAYAASDSVAVLISVAGTVNNFTITVDPGSLSVPSAKYVTAAITLKSSNGYTDTIKLGCLGLPFAATCTFDKPSVTLPANGSVTAHVIVDTGSPLTAGGGTTTARIETPSPRALLAFLPAGALLGWLLTGARRRRIRGSLLMLLIAMLILPMMGCGTITQASTPAGTYTFLLSAAGQGTDVTLSQSVSLAVTK